MLKEAVRPPDIKESVSATALQVFRAAGLPGMVSLEVRSLFEDIPQEIYLSGPDVSMVLRSTQEALAGVDMSRISGRDSVNILCSEHGFNMMGGKPYAEMLYAVRQVVEEKTRCENIRLRLCVGSNHSEARDILKHFPLEDLFAGRVKAVGPFDPGQAIETEIGTLYCLKGVYDADWFIHCHYDDPREVYLHRLISRALKSFAMSYARFETRSVLHINFGTRSSNIVARAIFESPFVQNKHAFSCFLVTSPAGVVGVDADHDMKALNQRLTINTLKGYGKLMRIFAAIDECVVVLDGGRWPWYLHAGGLASCNLFKAPTDYLDLDVGSKKRGVITINPAVKGLVVNNVWGSMLEPLALVYPVFAANEEVARGLPGSVARVAHTAESLEGALAMACERAGTDKVIVFDGCYGSINLSRSLGELLIAKAPEISREVDEKLLPKWLRQRGIEQPSP